jgi:hypothetical protein
MLFEFYKNNIEPICLCEWRRDIFLYTNYICQRVRTSTAWKYDLTEKTSQGMGKAVRLHAVKECVGSRGFIPPILSLGSTWRSVTNFTPWEKALRAYLIGGYVDPERGL